MRFSWHELLFAHWPVAPATMRALVPRALDIDTFDGAAWIGVVPFRMTRVGPRWLPPIPGFSSFCELNVRTYAVYRGQPGVWFFSLDAANRLAVAGARRYFHLPYFRARMSCVERDGWVEYESIRTHKDAPPATFRGRYRGKGAAYRSREGDLDHWLTARYCLFTIDGGSVLRRCDIAHPQWPLEPAEAEIDENRMAAPLGIALEGAPRLHFSRRIDVLSGPLVPA